MSVTTDSLQILVVEDNMGDFLLIQEYFREEMRNPILVHVQNFSKSKEVLQSGKAFNAILLDLSLPDASGENLVNEMVVLAGDVPIIVLTGYEDKNFGIKTLSIGISDYLLKDELTPSVLIKSLVYSIERKKIGLQLQEAEEERKKHSMEITRAIFTAQEKERVEIGGELHDNVNQLLTAAKINLRLAREEKHEDKLLEWISNSSNYINMALSDIRQLSHRLAPRSFSYNSLIEAFDKLLQSINLEGKFTIELTQVKCDESLLPEDLKLNVYRILQEQVKNILNYAEATTIQVHLEICDNTFLLSIRDNGKGFDVEKKQKGIGLNNIKQRAELFNGNLKINSSPGSGCEILVEIPL